MSRKRLVGTLSAVVLAGVPVAVAAASDGPHHPNAPQHPANSHKCKAHAVAYRVSGTLVSSNLTVSGSGGHKTASGPIMITVTSANKAARNAGVIKGSAQNYTPSGAKVTYAHNLAQPNPPAGTHTEVKGTITVVSKKCTDTTGAGTLTIKRVSFTPHKH